MEKQAQISTHIEAKGMEVTGHTNTQAKPERHVGMLGGHEHWDLVKPLRQIPLVGFIMGHLDFGGCLWPRWRRYFQCREDVSLAAGDKR